MHVSGVVGRGTDLAADSPFGGVWCVFGMLDGNIYPNPVNSYGLGTRMSPDRYKFIWLGDSDGHKPYKLVGFVGCPRSVAANKVCRYTGDLDGLPRSAQLGRP